MQQDTEGHIFFVGRNDDIITSAGYRIGPFDVESSIIEHPSVAEVAVVGKPDPERTEIVKAFVVLRPGFDPSDALKAELQQQVRTEFPPFSTRSAPEFARQSQPAKFRFPDHEMEPRDVVRIAQSRASRDSGPSMLWIMLSTREQ